MRAEYDFSKGERKALISTKGKTRISIFIDNEVIEAFRKRAEAAGTGYQTMMNEALRAYLAHDERPVTQSQLRAILEELLPSTASGPTSRSTRAARKRAAG